MSLMSAFVVFTILCRFLLSDPVVLKIKMAVQVSKSARLKFFCPSLDHPEDAADASPRRRQRPRVAPGLLTTIFLFQPLTIAFITK